MISEPAAYCHSDCGVSQILAPSVNEMIMHSMGDGSAGYTSDTKQESSQQGYSQDVQPIHSVGINQAYSNYGASAAVQA